MANYIGNEFNKVNALNLYHYEYGDVVDENLEEQTLEKNSHEAGYEMLKVIINKKTILNDDSTRPRGNCSNDGKYLKLFY